MDVWTNFLQVALTLMASNYQIESTQHRRRTADNKNRRHTNVQPNLQYHHTTPWTKNDSHREKDKP